MAVHKDCYAPIALFQQGGPHRRETNQKLFPHFGEAGTAVFAVEEVEYGGHDPTSLFELICTICSELSFVLGSKM